MTDTPHGSTPPPAKPILQVRNLRTWFPIRAGFFSRVVGQVKAVDDVSFDVYPGECLSLVGESGSGKTTVGRSILRAVAPTGGQVLFRHDGVEHDVIAAGKRTLKELRRHMQMVFQDPYSSLNPRMTVLDIVAEPLLVHRGHSRTARHQRVRELLEQVGLRPEHMLRYPHAFSGGQRQRIGIARALALQPRLIIADEPVSALDVSVQAQVINLLQQLQRQLGLTYLFIAHDLSVVRYISDRVAVMYLGRLVELAPVDALFARPFHPYTRMLLAAAPVPDPSIRPARSIVQGQPAEPSNPPPGCAFHPRCPHCVDRCRSQTPQLREMEPGRFVRCHLADDIAARPSTSAFVKIEAAKMAARCSREREDQARTEGVTSCD